MYWAHVWPVHTSEQAVLGRPLVYWRTGSGAVEPKTLSALLLEAGQCVETWQRILSSKTAQSRPTWIGVRSKQGEKGRGRFWELPFHARSCLGVKKITKGNEEELSNDADHRDSSISAEDLASESLFFEKEETQARPSTNDSDNAHHDLKAIHDNARSNTNRNNMLGMHKGIKQLSMENDIDPSLMAASSPRLKSRSSGAPITSENDEDIEIISFLRSVPTFSHLAELQFTDLVHAVTKRKYAKGDIIVKQGDSGENAKEMFMIQSGLVHAFVKDSNPGEGEQGQSSAGSSTLAHGAEPTQGDTGDSVEQKVMMNSNDFDLMSLSPEEEEARAFLRKGQCIQKRTRSSRLGGQSWKERYIWVAPNPERLMWCHGEKINIVDANRHKNFVNITDISAVEPSRNEEAQFKVFLKGKPKSHALIIDVHTPSLDEAGSVAKLRDKWCHLIRIVMRTEERFQQYHMQNNRKAARSSIDTERGDLSVRDKHERSRSQQNLHSTRSFGSFDVGWCSCHSRA